MSDNEERPKLGIEYLIEAAREGRLESVTLPPDEEERLKRDRESFDRGEFIPVKESALDEYLQPASGE